MVNTEIILIIFFAAKDGEALYNSQQKSPKCNTWVQFQKWQNVIQVYTPTTNAKQAEVDSSMKTYKTF